MNVTDAKLVKYERTRSINFKKLFKDGHYKKTIFVSPYLYDGLNTPIVMPASLLIKGGYSNNLRCQLYKN